MGLVLLVLIPVVAFAALSAVMVGVLGFLLPALGQQSWGSFVWDPWFQALVKMLLLVLGVVMPMASLLTWAERKQSAMMQDRIGPNRAAIGGVRAWGIMHFV